MARPGQITRVLRTQPKAELCGDATDGQLGLGLIDRPFNGHPLVVGIALGEQRVIASPAFLAPVRAEIIGLTVEVNAGLAADVLTIRWLRRLLSWHVKQLRLGFRVWITRKRF